MNIQSLYKLFSDKIVHKYNFAVIFDMDGVIVNSNPVHKIALREFCERYGHFLTEDELKNKIYGRANKDWLPELFNKNFDMIKNALNGENWRL